MGEQGEREMVELNREVAELKTMMSMVLQSIRDMQTDLKMGYVTKAEYEELKRQVHDLKSAPNRWLGTIIAVAAVVVAYLKP